MCEANHTQITQVILLGFQGLNQFKPLFFIVALVSYVVILFGNLLIVMLVTTVDRLKIPMFVFLKHLAIADVLQVSTTVPLMLNIILVEEMVLSVVGCFAQLYFFGVFVYVQCYIIAAMSYDRYLAICTPLRYASLMNPQVCFQIAVGLWFFGTLMLSSEMIVLCQLSFCGLNYIDHFFCDFAPVVELATSDKSHFLIQDFVTTLFMIPLPFVFILMTYISISVTILKMASANRRKKTFSTCSSHLATVCTSYGSLITVYVVPMDYNIANINKYRSFLYIMVAPLMNPIIYSLRNQEVKRALLKVLSNFRTTL
ncbi:olfactory receptor 11A1-like [Hyperolius riggenbachi]|uniref:olfactory receptor 11A1-like n=1 Tax=Hyperolius riggenbachi TaxID=752182 RepID=UPI0035A30890